MAKFAEKPAAEVVAAQPLVRVRVTKRGDMKISTGEHVAMMGDKFYEAGDEFEVAQSIGADLEERGLVEIQVAKAPAKGVAQ